MLRSRARATTLNVKPSQQVSVMMVYLTLALVAATARWPLASLAALAAASAVTALNLDLYRYLASRKGLWFMLRAVPLHWLYFLYCGLCVISGTLLHYLADGSGPGSTRPQARAASKTETS
jgi:hypothetical protein